MIYIINDTISFVCSWNHLFNSNERQPREEDISYFSGVDPKFSQMEWDLMWGERGFVTSYVRDSTSFSKTPPGAVTHFEVGSW